MSGTWEQTGKDEHPAPWLKDNSLTPADRWWSARHKKEGYTGNLKNAYDALRVPENHQFVLTGNQSSNDAHGSTDRSEEFVPQWKIMIGTASSNN